MDKVTRDFTESELWAFVNEVNRLMIDLNLTEREVIGLLKMTTGFVHDFTPIELMGLQGKGMLADPDKVSDKFLDSGKTPVQATLDLVHESKPKTSEIAAQLVDNIAKALLSTDKKHTDKEILDLAKSKFNNDLT